MGPIPYNLATSKDDIAWPPPLYKPVPTEAAWESLSHLLTLDFVRLEADALFEVIELLFRSEVDLDCLIIISMLPKPVVWHLARNRWWLALITTADNLNSSFV